MTFKKDPHPKLDQTEIKQASPLIVAQDHSIHLLRGDQIPRSLEALGRARAITFAAAGQGTGAEIDLTPEDIHYHHLLLVRSDDHSLMGAYRLGFTKEILETQGPSGLYLNGVFEISEGFFSQIGPSIELSRSFVLPAFQKDNQTLGLLWKGLGLAARQHGVRTLYGSVTMANNYRHRSRSLAVAFLRKHFRDTPEMQSMVRAANPFEAALIDDEEIPERISQLDRRVLELEDGQRRLPPLMRYYCQLGARFIDFHVEAAFADALYCLLRVDLDRIPAAYQKRFL